MTSATLRSSAAAITSSSRSDPPGSTTTPTPASQTASRPSRNGKNASLAPAPPSALPAAFSSARRAASRRFLAVHSRRRRRRPPSRGRSRSDPVAAQTRQASSASSHSGSVGSRLVTTRQESVRGRRHRGLGRGIPRRTRAKPVPISTAGAPRGPACSFASRKRAPGRRKEPRAMEHVGERVLHDHLGDHVVDHSRIATIPPNAENLVAANAFW